MSDTTIHAVGYYRRETVDSPFRLDGPAKRALFFFSSCALTWGAAIVLILAVRDAVDALL